MQSLFFEDKCAPVWNDDIGVWYTWYVFSVHSQFKTAMITSKVHSLIALTDMGQIFPLYLERDRCE